MYIIIITSILTPLILFALILLGNIARHSRKPEETLTPFTPTPLSKEEIEIFSEALQIRTVSSTDEQEIDREQFERYRQFLSINFPVVHTKLKVVWINPFAFYTVWKGEKPELKPVLFYSHFDVVPAAEEGWTHPPFSGVIEEGCIWGRGALDTKNTMIGSLLALEELLMSGHTPQRTIVMACGGDEECMGLKGAGELAALFKEQGMEFEWMLDEGSIVQEGMLEGFDQPIALIGTEEKGFLNLTLTAEEKSGHASMPPRHTAAGILGRAITRLEYETFPPRLTPTMRDFFVKQIPYVGFGKKLVFANLRLFRRSLFKTMDKASTSASLIRTTQAVTMLKGSDRVNVLPEKAVATVNLRLLPGETMESATQAVIKKINDKRVSVAVLSPGECNNPIPSSSLTGPGMQALNKALSSVIPQALRLPFTTNVTTDSRRFYQVCPNIYRFSPLKLRAEDLALIHSDNERISLENLTLGINFYRYLLQIV